MQIQFGPALGIIELASIATGYAAMDVLVKKAPVRILEGSMVSPGKFLILFNGDEASVEESYKAVSEKGWSVLDSVLIPNVDTRVLPGLYGLAKVSVKESLLIVEVASMASSILSCDASLKMADVDLIEIKSSRGIGGKSIFFVTGSLDAAQAAQEAVQEALKTRGTLLRTELIARPHEDFLSFFNITGEG